MGFFTNLARFLKLANISASKFLDPTMQLILQLINGFKVFQSDCRRYKKSKKNIGNSMHVTSDKTVS